MDYETTVLRPRLLGGTSRALLCLLALVAIGCGFGGEGSILMEADPQVPTATIRHEGKPVATAVQVALNDEPVWLLLDSGAQISVLDIDTATTLALPRIGGARIGSCRKQVGIHRGDRLAAGQGLLQDSLFAVLELDPLLEGMEIPAGVDIGGVLGAPIFHHTVVAVDYEPAGDRVAFHDPESYQLPHGDWQPLRVVDDRPFVEATFEGGRSGWFTVDTGKSESVSFFSSYTAQEKLLEGRAVRPEPNRRICGETEEQVGSLDWLELAGRRFEGVRAAFKPPGTLGDRPIAIEIGHMGQGIFRASSLILDLPHSRVAFPPREGAAKS